jgi:hypothetical protein
MEKTSKLPSPSKRNSKSKREEEKAVSEILTCLSDTYFDAGERSIIHETTVIQGAR